MIVFGVCALGVGSLYLVPSMAGAPLSSGLPQPGDRPDGATSGPYGGPPQAAATGAIPATAATAATSPAAPQPQIGRATATSLPSQPGPQRRSPGRTAFDGESSRDEEPPSAVAEIEPAGVTSEELSLSWPAATDNTRVIGYRIWLNGYEVASTAETQATVRWFNDDGGQHVVQVKAIDAAGNLSTSSPTLLITRPSTEPSSTPSPETTPTPTPTGDPTPSVAPTTGPSAESTPAVTEPGPKATDEPQ
ncbi:MAG TPA: hypothetical protein VLJ88_14735 [Propionibacteriaceae bacterium]|nr:hypothetical protein [Propionibacteriaceae bacterium]